MPIKTVSLCQLCDRNFGIGGDGVIFALPGKDGTDYTMRIYNSDGADIHIDSMDWLGTSRLDRWLSVHHCRMDAHTKTHYTL